MTSLSYLLAYHLYGTINSSWCDTDDGSSFHLLGFSVLLWLFSFQVGKICLWILPKFCKTVLHKSLVKITHSWQGVLSPVFCPQLGHVSCSFCADHSQHIVLALTGGPMGELCSSWALWQTSTHRHGVDNVSLSPHSHPVTLGSQWSKSCFRVCLCFATVGSCYSQLYSLWANPLWKGCFPLFTLKCLKFT